MQAPNCFKLDKPEDARQWHTKAIEFLDRSNIPAIPVCYHVAYMYVSQRNQELTCNIDMQLKKSDSLDSHFLLHLFESQCMDNTESDRLDEHLADLHGLLYKVLEGVTHSCDHTEHFNQTLLQQTQALDANPSLKDLQGIANTLLEATTEAMQNNQQMREHLQSAEQHSHTLQSEVKQLRDEISVDALTGLFNRRALNKRMQELVDKQSVTETPFSILMLDIDHFKQFNDNFGHMIGDEVIRRVGLIMRDTVGEEDFPARFGGEEFTVLLPTADINNALTIAESIHQSIGKLVLLKRSTKEKLPSISVSVGDASFHQGDSFETLLERADQALYQAKEEGRNRIVSESINTHM
ncbi:MAG: GGDEF domain-containing protein [Candidatus Thiodiazotropha sp. (ex Lucinoma borealis)]|nr:GGDEF domain-containing protein [Candidatus Thiodiazotropha sp. (ex Lucinoma borealis)]